MGRKPPYSGSGDDIPPPRPPLRLVPPEATPPHVEPPAKRKRSSRVETQKRVEFAETMEANGFQTHRILWSLTQEFGVSERQAAKYLQVAREKMQEHRQIPTEQKRAQWEAMLMNNYREAVRGGDLRAANRRRWHRRRRCRGAGSTRTFRRRLEPRLHVLWISPDAWLRSHGAGDEIPGAVWIAAVNVGLWKA